MINKTYNKLLEQILENGYRKYDKSRNIDTKEISYYTLEHDMSTFPLLTTKKLSFSNIVSELIWFMQGNTDIRYLWQHNNKIWDKDYWNWIKKRYNSVLEKTNITSLKQIKENHEFLSQLVGDNFFSLGKIYGYQWRKGEDAFISRLYNFLKNPNDRGHVMVAWNEDDLTNMALRPCHFGFRIVMKDDLKFDLIWEQRSVDVALGLPYNIASYALLGKMIERITERKFDKLVGFLSNVHIYEPHIEKMQEQLTRDPEKYDYPTVKFNKYESIETKDQLKMFIDSIDVSDFELKNYKSYPLLKMDMLALK